MLAYRTIAILSFVAIGISAAAYADERSVEKPAEIRADEPMLGKFDLSLARQSLDRSAWHWQKAFKCVSCHTTAAYMISRPSIQGDEAAYEDIRSQLEEMVEEKWERKLPAPGYVVATAASLAINDQRKTGKLDSTSKKALDRMWEVQRTDGGFDWLNCGWAPMELDDHYGVTFAAIAVGTAPDGYAKNENAAKGLEGIKKYLADHPAPTTHHRAMMLWASQSVDGILTKEKQQEILSELTSLQRPDGGWSLSGMLVDWPEFKRKDDLKPLVDVSDAYGTGMVIWIAVNAGVPVADERIQKGVGWLKTNQRESGRWFTPSPTKDSKHFITNTGTAWAVMALDACGETAKVTANK